MIRPVAVSTLLLLTGCAGSIDSSEDQPTVGGKADSFGGCALPALAHQRVFPALSFHKPVQLLQAPRDRARWFVVERGGTIKVFANDPAVTTADLFLDLSGRTKLIYESGLNGLAFDPAFADNGEVYVTYKRGADPRRDLARRAHLLPVAALALHQPRRRTHARPDLRGDPPRPRQVRRRA